MALTPNFGTSGLTEDQRSLALARFHILRLFLEENVPLATLAQQHDLNERTLRRWANNYRQHGLAGLCRPARADKSKRRRMSPTLQQCIEGFALKQPRLTAAAVHRQAAAAAARLGEPVPSYRTVHRVIQQLDPALVTLAHEGTKSYSDTFDLVHRRDAEAPNAIWQADHSELDILVKDDEDQPRKPWLTVVLDDYSRSVAGMPISNTVSARYYANPKKIASSRPRSPADGKVEKGVANKTILYTPSVVNSPGKIARELGTCRSNFETALLRQLAKEEQPNLEHQHQLLDDKLQAAGWGSAAAEERRGDAYRQYFTTRKHATAWSSAPTNRRTTW
jgi:transposase-like protein